MLGTALYVMLLGMGGVGAFLVLLVLVMYSLTVLAPAESSRRSPAQPTAGPDSDLTLIAVVQAVIAAYESEQQEQMRSSRSEGAG